MGRRKPEALIGLVAKYGSSVRKRHGRVVRLLKKKRQCPSCGSMKFRREVSGIWTCPMCSYKLADGAYDTPRLGRAR